MREEIDFYGIVDGLSPKHKRCDLHGHDEEMVVRHRMNATSIHWAPFVEERLKSPSYHKSTESEDERPLVALLGAYCPEHPLLPNMTRYTFIETHQEIGDATPVTRAIVGGRKIIEDRAIDIPIEHQKYVCVATHCAGVISATPTHAMEGMAPNCRLQHLQVIDIDGKSIHDAITNAIKFARRQKVKIICIPFTIPFNNRASVDIRLRKNLMKAARAGILIVAAKGPHAYSFPADEAYVCSVGSFNKKYEFSHQEVDTTLLADVAAPGEGIWSLHPIYQSPTAGVDLSTHEHSSSIQVHVSTEVGTFCRMSGVAMATCLVAGLAARIDTQSNPQLGAQFQEWMKNGAALCTVHPYPLKVSHLINLSEFLPIVAKKEDDESQTSFLSLAKQSDFSFTNELGERTFVPAQRPPGSPGIRRSVSDHNLPRVRLSGARADSASPADSPPLPSSPSSDTHATDSSVVSEESHKPVDPVQSVPGSSSENKESGDEPLSSVVDAPSSSSKIGQSDRLHMEKRKMHLSGTDPHILPPSSSSDDSKPHTRGDTTHGQTSSPLLSNLSRNNSNNNSNGGSSSSSGASSAEEKRQWSAYEEYQKKVYKSVLEASEKKELDHLLLMRMKQHHTLSSSVPVIQPYLVPDESASGDSSSKKKLTVPHAYKPVCHLSVIDWALHYFLPVTSSMQDDQVLVAGSNHNVHVQMSLEAIHILINKRVLDQELEEILWSALEHCKGVSYDKWTVIPTLQPEENFSMLRSRIKYQSSKSELKAVQVFAKQTLFIPNVWEFCRRLTDYEAIAEAEPLFLETELQPGRVRDSVLLHSADPSYELAVYVGIEPNLDLSDLGDDVTIAHLDTGYRKHECLGRANLLYDQGWDYVRHKSWKNLNDTWLFGQSKDSVAATATPITPGRVGEIGAVVEEGEALVGMLAQTAKYTGSPRVKIEGSHGLATLSVFTGVARVTSGLAPNCRLLPFRCFTEQRHPYDVSHWTTEHLPLHSPSRGHHPPPSRASVHGGSASSPVYLGVIQKSTLRLYHALAHARKAGADVICIPLGLVTPSFTGILRRLIQLADKENIIIVASVGEFSKYQEASRVVLFPPGGSVISPAKFPETIGTAGCTADDSPWAYSCCGPQTEISSLCEFVIVAAHQEDEVVKDSGARGVTGSALSASTVASLAALWLSYHHKEKLVKIYQSVAPLSTVFKYVLQRSVFTPTSWSSQTSKIFGRGTTRNIVDKMLKLPLPTPTEVREFFSQRKRSLPPLFGLDFLTSECISIHLQREINFLYNTQSHFRKLPRQKLYQEVLGSLSTPSQRELVTVIEKTPYITYNENLGISMFSDGFLIASNNQVYDLAKEMNLTKKTNAAPANFVPPTAAWRSVFYVGKDYGIHQLYWFQSIKHWVVGLYYKNISQEYNLAKAKRTLGPIAFYHDKFYYVYFVSEDNTFYLLRSFEQTHVWHCQVVPLVNKEKDTPVFVHPDAGVLSREPQAAAGTTPTCVAFPALMKNGGWQIQHVVGIPEGPSVKVHCPAGIPHHHLTFSPIAH